jgi:hypothetical protein
MFCAMFHSLSFVQSTAPGLPYALGSLVQVSDWSGGQPEVEPSTATGTGAQVLAEFVLMDDPVIRLISTSDRVLRLVAGVIKPDDLIATLPGLGPTVLRVGDGLSHRKEMLP